MAVKFAVGSQQSSNTVVINADQDLWNTTPTVDTIETLLTPAEFKKLANCKSTDIIKIQSTQTTVDVKGLSKHTWKRTAQETYTGDEDDDMIQLEFVLEINYTGWPYLTQIKYIIIFNDTQSIYCEVNLVSYENRNFPIDITKDFLTNTQLDQLADSLSVSNFKDWFKLISQTDGHVHLIIIENKDNFKDRIRYTVFNEETSEVIVTDKNEANYTDSVVDDIIQTLKFTLLVNGAFKTWEIECNITQNKYTKLTVK